MSEEREQLLEEIDRLKVQVADLQSGMYVTCVYCGHRFGQLTGAPAMTDVLRVHVETCQEHPMAALKAELEAVRKARDAACTLAQNCAARLPAPQLRNAMEQITGFLQVGAR